ncbi:ABC transporter ATP-binding protein [Paenibacillus apiarius]|uniref:ABC transporter ATP-binding protein n=1 Tax=Paenibacillus apiarius TaxID=46240 RepID=UPI001981DAF3|nr:ABC transporter ATP-binding protein [Paenibacillus apiarius]MBN3525198.1 ABC transporter ATP-binding protein [Paenibacillus apiarius]
MSKIVLEHAAKTYGHGDAAVSALVDVNLEIESGEMVAIMGRSGSGKSTLLNILGGLTSLDQGEYYFDGEKINFERPNQLSRFRRNHIGFIVQHYALIYDRTVFDNVALPLKYNKRSKTDITASVSKVLKDVGIYDLRNRYPSECSGGQCQRTAIARAIVNDADVLLADEPTGALDENTESSIMELFHSLHKQGKTIVMVTHDTDIAGQCARIIDMNDGMANPRP